MGKGKSYSAEYPLGIRSMSNGRTRAPKSLRKLGLTFVSDCSDSQIDGLFGIKRSELRETEEGAEQLGAARLL